MNAKKLLTNKLVLAVAALLVVTLIADETFARPARGRGGGSRVVSVGRGGHGGHGRVVRGHGGHAVRRVRHHPRRVVVARPRYYGHSYGGGYGYGHGYGYRPAYGRTAIGIGGGYYGRGFTISFSIGF